MVATLCARPWAALGELLKPAPPAMEVRSARVRKFSDQLNPSEVPVEEMELACIQLQCIEEMMDVRRATGR